MRLQRIGEIFLAGNKVDRAITNNDAVVNGIHVGPFQIAIGDHIKNTLQHGGSLHFADVVHAHIPFKALALIGVRKAASGVMLLQHANFLTEL